MPKLGEILYNNLNNNLMNEPLLEDKDSEEKTKELKNSLEKLAKFFLAMRNASALNEDNQNLFNAAHNFCNAMKKKVEKSPDNDNQNTVKKSPDIINEAQNTIISNNARLEPYKKFDDELDDKEFDDKWDDKAFDNALDLLFAEENKRKARELTFRLDTLNNLARQKASQPDPQKPDRLTIGDIHNSNALYQNKTSGPLEVIHTVNNLIEGINGLQSYIKDNTDQKSSDAISDLANELKENIKLAKNKVIEQQKKIDPEINKYLLHLDLAFTNSHRFLGNSTEYGKMLNSAKVLQKKWADATYDERKRFAQEAKTAADEYITRKKGNNTDKNWTPITKEGKKRFALAKFLRDTADDLLNKYLTTPDNKMLENDKTIIIENDISDNKKSNIFEINNSKKNEHENEDIISENNENDDENENENEKEKEKENEKEDDIIEENDIRKKNDDENDIRKKNDDNKENYFIETINKNLELSSTMHDYPIKLEAESMFDNYRAKYRFAESKEDKKDWLAKAAAVNVLMHLAIKGYFKSEYTMKQLFSNTKEVMAKIFSEKKIKAVAAAVKKLPSFNNQDAFANTVFKNKDKPATQLDPNDTAAKLMDTKDIIDLIDRIDKKKLLNGLPKAGSAPDTSNKPGPTHVNNQYGTKISKKL